MLAAALPLASAVLAAGASDYVYQLDNWATLLPFHLYRAAQAAQTSQEVLRLTTTQQQSIRQLAHDLRGPLSYLVGYSELLTMQDLPPATVRQMAQEMLREAEKLAAQIERFAPPPVH
jgi:signal transduction histidine kinase